MIITLWDYIYIAHLENMILYKFISLCCFFICRVSCTSISCCVSSGSSLSTGTQGFGLVSSGPWVSSSVRPTPAPVATLDFTVYSKYN